MERAKEMDFKKQNAARTHGIVIEKHDNIRNEGIRT